MGKIAAAGNAAHVGRDHHGGLAVLAEELEVVFREYGHAYQVIQRYIEKALDLRSVEIHCKDAVSSGGGQEVCYQLGGDGIVALGLAILPRIAEIGHNCGNAPGACPAAGVDHDKELHEVVVYRVAGGLDKENIGAADGLIKRNGDLAIRKMRNRHIAETGSHMRCNVLR